jgi:very-short-patch-repair endonuclease
MVWADRLDAAVAYAGEGAMLSGAAALCGLGLRAVPRPSEVLVLAPPAREPPAASRSYVRIRRTARLPEAAAIPGPPRAHPARAVADLSLELPRLDDVRTVVAQSVRRRLCTIDQIAAALAAGPRRGSAHLRRPDGRFLIADFLWRDLNAILEIDSVEHHLDPADWRARMDRHPLLETVGHAVVHRAPAAIFSAPDRFVRDIGACLPPAAPRGGHDRTQLIHARPR